MSNSTPLFSIITATYNAGDTLLCTIESIKKQGFSNFEYIVIDGGSTDNTISIISTYYPDVVNKYISEPDQGIYDAWNKGLKLANGKWISFLGAGDTYLPDALQNYASYIDTISEEIEFISSRVNVVSSGGKTLYVIGRAWQWPAFLNTMMTAHVGALHAKTYFSQYGRFNSSYKIAGDYELLMRAGNSLKSGFLSTPTANMLYGGVSQSFLVLQEDMRLKINTGKVSSFSARFEYLKNFIKTVTRKIFHSFSIFRSVKE